jgi:NAD(P)H-hydrate epimerase
VRVATAAEMRALDRATIDQVGIPGVVLMENAGVGVVRALLERLGPKLARARVGIVCGGGNNGGDGYVVARHLWNRGVDARAYVLAQAADVHGDARIQLDAMVRTGVPVVTALDLLDQETVIVDALLGTGLKAEVRGAARATIERINALPRRVLRVAVDLPSGLDADTGQPLGACVRADLTVTMGLCKLGCAGAPGFEWCGDLVVVDIGIPRDLPQKQGVESRLLDPEEVAPLVPARPRSANKGSFGHLLVVAGSRGKTGAALLCGEAALRAGVGLCTLATRPDAQAALEGRVRELMTAGFDDEPALIGLLTRKRAVALGPGIPADDAMRSLVERFAVACPLPMVIDADGLNALAATAGLATLREARGPRVLTPHPGEAARLLERSIDAVQADRVASARALAARSGAVVALKGARTVIAAPDGRVALNPTGNPGLATGGTGDVLTGLIGALLAQGLSADNAAKLGVYAHGRAADLWVEERATDRGMIARDVIARLPSALRVSA